MKHRGFRLDDETRTQAEERGELFSAALVKAITQYGVRR